MQNTILFVLASLALSLAFPAGPANPLPKPEDRQRETTYKIEDPGTLNVLHRQKVFEDSKHRVDATGILKQDLLNIRRPTQVGGRVDYNYKPADTKLGVEAINNGRFGTDVGVEATRNVFKGRNSDLEIGAKYGQHFGGPGGRSEPSFGGFVRGHF
ncbi:hypothetical protein Zmor_024006 [Zophobas morio]|uniref:Attacin C-terminal domain-containing protein n=1 Tax=Zophobas morio TaxID=2755281 RepID=A0AA38M8G6_9CUCU|nr:hypothetical protein Zmor_024006 [Zophobas morio]